MIYHLLILSVAFLLGGILGFLHFTGLWITVNYLPKTRRPVFFLLLSFMLRMSVILGAFYFIMGEKWQRLFACLLGFILARIILVRIWAPGVKSKQRSLKNGNQP
jgi:F1F0 ATPase subunit 2